MSDDQAQQKRGTSDLQNWAACKRARKQRRELLLLRDCSKPRAHCAFAVLLRCLFSSLCACVSVDSLVVDEVKRMKIICEILRMPEDEPGIRRLVHESSSALAKLQEVALPRTEGEHYGKPHAAAPAATHAAPVAHAAGAGAAGSASSSLAVPPSSSAQNGKSPSPSPSPSRSPSASPAPTLLDYQTASIPALALEMRSRKEGALEELDDRCLTSDNANDFMTVGGIEPLLIAMLSAYPGIKWRAAQALSTMVQNNPKAQKHAFDHRALEYLLPLLKPPTADPAAPADGAAPASSSSAAALPLPPTAADSADDGWTVVVKALTALSALVRSDDLPEIRQRFMDLHGFDLLCTLVLTKGVPLRAQTKLFNFLKLVWGWFPSAKGRVLQEKDKHILPVLVGAVGASDDISHREACLRALLEFAKPTGTPKDHAASKALRERSLGLEARLHARHKQLKSLKSQEDREQAQEEMELTNALIKACKF